MYLLMQPSVLPIQILQIGQLVILSVPGGELCYAFVFFVLHPPPDVYLIPPTMELCVVAFIFL